MQKLPIPKGNVDDLRSVTANKLSSMNAQAGQVLKFDGMNWGPANISSSQLYLGTYDAATNTPNLSLTTPNSGDYYIVAVQGTYNSITYPVNSWIMFNGTDWEKISNSENIVSSFKGRRGLVVPMKNDYNLGQMSNVDLVTTPPAPNQFLKYNGTNWVPGATLPTCGVGQVLKSDGINFSCVTDNSGAGAFSGTPNMTVVTDGAGVLTVSSISDTVLGYLSGASSNIQTQLNNKQPLDATLTSLAAHNTNGILVQAAADTFTGRTLVGTANRITVTNGDGVAGNPTIDIASGLLPSPAGGDAGKILKATGANASTWTALGLSDVTTALGFTPVNKLGDTIASGTFTFNGAAVLRALDPVGISDVATKNYVDSFGQWTVSGSDIYRSTGNVGIGTTTPSSKLNVLGGDSVLSIGTSSEDVAGIPLQVASGFTKTNTTLQNIAQFRSNDLLASQPLELRVQQLGNATSASQAMVLQSGHYGLDFLANLSINPYGGNVGIGTISPTYKLDVAGGIKSDTGIYAVLGATATDLPFWIRNQGSGDHFSIDNGVSEIFRIKNNGTVGIATATPNALYKLDVNGKINGTEVCIAGTCKNSWSSFITDIFTQTLPAVSTAGEIKSNVVYRFFFI